MKYKDEWTGRFRSEYEVLKRLLGDVAVKIHHIGSTSVKGLGAKDLIDIMIEVISLDTVDRFNEELVKLGYEVKGENGIERRRFFMRRGADSFPCHIHAFAVGDSHITRHLAFRDYLIGNPQVRRQYEEIKKDAARRCGNNIEVYCDIKDPFIRKHEKAALELYNMKGISSL